MLTKEINTLTKGVDEDKWLSFIKSLPNFKIPDKAIYIISPHPDDETFGMGGLMATAIQKGLKIHLISVTNGEAAEVPLNNLEKIRICELKNSMSQLNVPLDSITYLGLPDGKVGEYIQDLLDRLDKIILRDSLIFCPFINEGHPDHEAVAKAALITCKAKKSKLIRFPIWSWHNHAVEEMKEKNLFKLELSKEIHEKKLEAIKCYKSQIAIVPDPIIPPHVLTYFKREYEVFEVAT